MRRAEGFITLEGVSWNRRVGARGGVERRSALESEATIAPVRGATRHPNHQAAGTRPMDATQRNETIGRIAERLGHFDDHALAELDRLTDAATYAAGATTEPQEAPVVSRRGLSRRQLVTGGVVVTAAALTSAIALSEGRTREAIARGAELDGLRRLTALHRRLESFGLDDRLRAALATVAAAFSVARAVAGAVASGIDLIEGAVRVFEQAMAPLEAGLKGLAAMTDGLTLRLDVLAGALQSGAGSVAQAVAQLIDGILERLPFGFAEQVRLALEGVRDVLALTPQTLSAATEGLIAPLRELWLPEERTNEPGLQGRLLTPLHQDLLDPARNLLLAIEGWQSAWSEEIEGAVEALLGERANVRAEIAQLETELGIAPPAEVG